MKVASIRDHQKHRPAPAARVEGVNLPILRRYSRLGGLPTAALERVAHGSESQLLPAENTIFCQDDEADAVYLLLDGEINLERRELDGYVARHPVFAPFGSFGDVVLLGEQSRFYSARTQSESIVLRTPLTLLRDALAADPALAKAWIQAVSTDLERRQQRLNDSIRRHIAHPAFFDAA